MYRLFFTVMLPVLAVMTASPAMAGGEPPPPPVTTSDCQSAFNSSPARQTCSLRNTWVTDNKCNFGAYCRYNTSTGNDYGDASINNVPKGDAGRINHCEPLVLQVGSC